MAKGKPFGGKGGKAPPFGKGKPPMKGKDPDAADDAAGFRKGGKVKRK